MDALKSIGEIRYCIFTVTKNSMALSRMIQFNKMNKICRNGLDEHNIIIWFKIFHSANGTMTIRVDVNIANLSRVKIATI